MDYETYSEVDITKAGAHVYASHPSTEILMLSWAIGNDPVQLWVPHQQPSIPETLYQALVDPSVTNKAFNAQFERLITRHVLGVDVPVEQWRCVMVKAFYLGFAGGLGQILQQIGLPDKDKRGNQLIHTFCKPAPKNHKARRYDWSNKPQDWADFCNYCVTDTVVERELDHWLDRFPGMHEWDWQQWFLDQRINDHGVPIDADMARSAVEIWRLEKDNLVDQLQEMSGLPKVTRDPFKQYVFDTWGIALENLTKDYLQSLLRNDQLPEDFHQVIALWLQKEGKAVSKYTAFLAGEHDGVVNGMFQYKGAQRTDRVGGRRVQLQNLKSPFLEDNFDAIDTLCAAIKVEDPRLLSLIHPMPVSSVLGGAIRHVISAPVGKTFAVADLSSIESVVLGWVSQCPLIDQTFRAGRDSYKVFAAEFYGIPYDQVTTKQRKFSKPPVLGAGFMLGWKGLIAYAEGYGVKMSAKEAKHAIDTFRTMYPEIVAFWKWVYGAVKTVTTTGAPITGYNLTIERDAEFLRIWLPSGRAISYFKPEVRRRNAPWRNLTDACKQQHPGLEYEDFIKGGWNDITLVQHGLMKEVQQIDNFCYMGMNDSAQWVRQFAHAGLITENIVQSIAGDILWHGLTGADAVGLQPVLHVHDEIVCLVDTATAQQDLALLQQQMTRTLPWAPDMWLGTSGYINHRYTKD